MVVKRYVKTEFEVHNLSILGIKTTKYLFRLFVWFITKYSFSMLIILDINLHSCLVVLHTLTSTCTSLHACLVV